MDIVKAAVGNGNLYEGEWYDGCPNGYGTMNYSTGSIYSGFAAKETAGAV